jgi:sirohydrochlorin cobaltochelatase
MTPTPTSTLPTAIVLLGHGSRDPLWQVPIQNLAERIRSTHEGMAVSTAFLEWAEPDLLQAVGSLVAAGHRRIRLLPLFFGMGKHAREDLPQLVDTLTRQYPTLELEVLPSAGEQTQVLDLLARLALSN